MRSRGACAEERVADSIRVFRAVRPYSSSYSRRCSRVQKDLSPRSSQAVCQRGLRQYLQRRILSLLEEAGEDDVAALLNGCDPLQGKSTEALEFANAVMGLANLGLVVCAVARDANTRRWIPQTALISQKTVEDLADRFHWAAADNVWRWMPKERLYILVTDVGLNVVRANESRSH